MRWRVPTVDQDKVAALSGRFGIKRLTAEIMAGRGHVDLPLAERFLDPRLAHLRPPGGMADLDRVLERLALALARGEQIGVFGDYDADGVTSAAILTLTLRGMGGRVIARVASRSSGYGLSPAEAARFADEGCTVLVTADCGTSDHDALALCRARGVDAIVIDHHQIPEGTTAAFALINPFRAEDTFPFKGLASCGVAFYIAAALRSRLRDAGQASAESFDPRALLDLVALGTIGDLVPLTDENRILVAAGLKELSARRRPGLAALADAADVKPGPISATDISFRLTPRLNAAGRLGEAQRALDLLLASDPEEARRRAGDLDGINRERQRIQELLWTEAQRAADLQSERGSAAIVVGADGWHQGVVGIVAAKLVEKYRRPVIVVGFKDGQGRGSARTVDGFNLFAALNACREHLVVCGGHAAAAGLTVDKDKFDGFATAFIEQAEHYFRNRPNNATVDADVVADLAQMDLLQVEELGRLGPFGSANVEPLVVFPGVVAQSTRVVGNGHLQLTLSMGAAQGDAIAFGMADRNPGSGARIDVIGVPEMDSYRGQRRIRLRVKHLLRADP